ncbi:hypothetical protein ACFY2V_14275 [Streptomyces eurythermus]|uniref:hypothetical protein n=1 Tax=Streptomyces eurythermus TaxID=42237 RepID=UPI0036ABC397
MDLASVFAGLDRVAWPELRHAYGPADDVPGMLRALAAGDEEAAAEAEQGVWDSLVHQGTVYPATVRAVPFLARLAAAGVRTADLLGVLGVIADGADERALDRPGAAHAAVVAQLPLLLPLLSDGTAEVRQCAAWTVAQCGPDAGPAARTALRWRWAAETDPVVRADVLTACVLVDPDAAEELCAAGLGPAEPAPVRVAAVLAGVEAGRPWDAALAATVAALAPLERHTEGSQWDREPLRDLVVALYERGEAAAATEVVASALDRGVAAVRAGADPGPAVTEATWAAETLALRSRSAPRRLLPAMLPLLDFPATAGTVITALRDWSEPAPDAVPALVRLAEGTGEPADDALAALVSLGTPEAADLLARWLADRPDALRAAFQRTLRRPPAPLPCTPALLDAVRARLAAVTAGSLAPGGHRPLTAGGLVAVNEPVWLAGLLAGWGPAARAATPELVAALPRHPVAVSRALAAVTDGTDADAVAALRACAGAGSPTNREAAATALHTLTGDAGPLIGVLETGLGGPGDTRDRCAQAAAALGERARPLLPRLLALLAEPAATRTGVPAIRAGLAAATAVWHLTGEGERVLPMILEGLGRAAEPWGDQIANLAAGAAALLGPAARPAVPHLLPMLGQARTAAAAARALAAVHPGSDRPAGVPLTELADRVLAAVAPSAARNPARAAVEALAALGPAALTPVLRERIRLLAEGDRRVIGSGLQTQLIHEDEEFRATVRRLSADPADRTEGGGAPIQPSPTRTGPTPPAAMDP